MAEDEVLVEGMMEEEIIVKNNIWQIYIYLHNTFKKMRKIYKVVILLVLSLVFVSCTDRDRQIETNEENSLSNPIEKLEMEASNEWGGDISWNSWNDSFR